MVGAQHIWASDVPTGQDPRSVRSRNHERPQPAVRQRTTSSGRVGRRVGGVITLVAGAGRRYHPLRGLPRSFAGSPRQPPQRSQPGPLPRRTVRPVAHGSTRRPKRQRRLGGIDEVVLSLYAKGLTSRRSRLYRHQGHRSRGARHRGAMGRDRSQMQGRCNRAATTHRSRCGDFALRWAGGLVTRRVSPPGGRARRRPRCSVEACWRCGSNGGCASWHGSTVR